MSTSGPDSRPRARRVPTSENGTEHQVTALESMVAVVSAGIDLVEYGRRIIRSPGVSTFLRWRMVAAARNWCGPDPEEIQ